MFSFNAGDGRCPTCGGSGFEHVEMQFLSDVYLRCPDCDGRRFRAEMLDVKGKGTANVRVQYVGKAPLDGHDMPFLMASYVPKGARGPVVDPGGQIATGVMVASAAPMSETFAAAVPTFAERSAEPSSSMTALAAETPETPNRPEW